MAKNESKLEKKLPHGRPRVTHGAVSFITHGRLPEHRVYLRRFLTSARENLLQDFGGEENMSTAQLILVDRVISKLAICRLIEEHVKDTAVMSGQNLAPALKQSYLAYCNSLRLDLQALGLNHKAEVNMLSPLEYIKQYDEQKKAEESGEKGATKTLNPAKKGAQKGSQGEILQG